MRRSALQFFDMQEEEAKLAKANKLDLIFNLQHPIADYEGLQHQYFEFGSVFLGGKEAVSDQYVYEKGIGAILTVMDKKSYDKEKMKEKVEGVGLGERHHFIDIKDSKQAKIVPFFKEAHQFIDNALENKQNVLVHCKGGMSRSASILCSYLMNKFSLTFDQAYKILRERRPIVDINEGFQNELKGYQKQLIKN